ncbi:MAG: hypothetical protein WBV11_05985 [Salegentibacter sp.]
MKLFDLGNVVVIAVTFILFAIALFTTGFTKDLLLETGVFLVSIKLIMMSRANSKANMEILRKLNEMNDRLS